MKGFNVSRRLNFCIFALLLQNITLFAQGSAEVLDGKIVKEIRIIGTRYTKRYVITRQLASQVGKPYQKGDAELDYERLERLGIFSFIKIRPIEQDGEVVIEITVKETFPYLPSVELKISDTNGLQVGAGFKSVNLAGKAIFFSVRALFGGATTIESIFENPWFAGNHMSYRLELYRRDRFNALAQFGEISTEFRVGLASYLGQRGRIGGYFDFISLASDSLNRTLDPDNRDNDPSIGFVIGYDNRDLWFNSHRGWWNEIEVVKSGLFGWGNSDFWRLNLDIRRYQPIIRHHTLALFSLTTLTTGTVGVDVATWQGFGLGGWNTVRGEPLNAVRGKYQTINTVEYRFTFLEPRTVSWKAVNMYIGLQLALFVDFGNAWGGTESDLFTTDDQVVGYGFGLNFLVPFSGMVRLHFAWGESGTSVQVGLRSVEKPITSRQRVR